MGRSKGGETFKRIALVGPVFKKVQKQDMKIKTQAKGKGT
jgi:hypothetical protein